MAHTELDLRERRTIEDMLNAKMPVRELNRIEVLAQPVTFLNGIYNNL